jgi:hypothetical protein
VHLVSCAMLPLRRNHPCLNVDRYLPSTFWDTKWIRCEVVCDALHDLFLMQCLLYLACHDLRVCVFVFKLNNELAAARRIDDNDLPRRSDDEQQPPKTCSAMDFPTSELAGLDLLPRMSRSVGAQQLPSPANSFNASNSGAASCSSG